MGQNKWKMAAFTLLTIVAATAGTKSATGQNVNKPAAGENQFGASNLSFEAARMYSFVKMPRAGELKWQQIPWLVDLEEAMRLAKKENRPLLIWVSGDDPLEKC